ncbi:nuclear transport factor 2 [Rippkaea orientalis PCC 8801]|uniref:Nuclear transport factor 2 n=1 Tax=Rippkaea orientalis (strain PCC 8801 / RF-1) TaxID=41431 RepID=B7K420_RIPO1|nr:ketosteroid isomerase family protein [Rippkaea orientalis]ACK66560.1 nuclear transport factor 2 [Rippkaea orientalis PCC 8801]
MTVIETTAIAGIVEPVIEAYFATLNAGQFEATADLFAVNGALHPPFESPVVGTEAIAAYLKAEAQGMTLYPRQGTKEPLENNRTQVNVTGKVQTPLFGVRVAWTFILQENHQIESVEVNLLASLAELANFQR